jgi:predicted  nucleic acid-binding Zn-ribbon protein
MKVQISIKDMVNRRKLIEQEMRQLDDIINYLSEKYDDLLDELKDLDSDLSYIENSKILEAE